MLLLLQNFCIHKNLDHDTGKAVEAYQRTYQGEEPADDGKGCQKADDGTGNDVTNNVDQNTNNEVRNRVGVLKRDGEEFLEKFHNNIPFCLFGVFIIATDVHPVNPDFQIFVNYIGLSYDCIYVMI